MRSTFQALLSGISPSLRWLIIISVLLRLVNLPVERFWYDESYTAIVAALPLPRMLAAIAGDVHPPLWYLIEWPIVHLVGQSELAMRLPALLFSVCGLIELYKIVHRLMGNRAALYAGALYAVMPGIVYYGQEARMYALLTWLVLYAARALHEKNWTGFQVSSTLALYTQNLAILYVGVLLILAFLTNRKKAITKGVGIAAGYTPWIPFLLKQISDVGDGFWLPPMGNPGGVIYYWFFGTLKTGPQWAIPSLMVVSIFMTTLAVFVNRDRFRQLSPLLALAFLPPALLGLVSVLWRPMFLDRAMIPASAALLGLWGGGVDKLAPDKRKLLAWVLGPALALSVGAYYYNAFTTGRANLSFLELLNAEYQPRDIIYHTDLASLLAGTYYLPDKDQAVLPGAGDLAQSLSDNTKEVMGVRDMELSMDQIVERGYCRAWLLDMDTPVVRDDARAMIQEIRSTYPIQATYPITHEDMVTFDIVLMELPCQK